MNAREPVISSVDSSKHAKDRMGVVLINLGTPDAPTRQAIGRYLVQFLSDRRVVELSPILWQPLLRLWVAPLRARALVRKYASVWLAEGSPLRVHTEQQVKALQARLNEKNQAIIVRYAMRYGSPSLAECFEQLKANGVTRILLLPMYPQYSASTTASAWDAAWAALRTQRVPPEIQTIAHYADFPPYINALAEHIRTYWAKNGAPDFAQGDRLLLSFHGLPQRMVENGDPYAIQCQTTVTLLRAALCLTEEQCLLTFQSRFGLDRWLEPYTFSTLQKLGAASVKRVDVFCPGFSADCLETIEEVGYECREAFLQAGGKRYNRIPCLNTTPAFIDCLAALIDTQRPEVRSNF